MPHLRSPRVVAVLIAFFLSGAGLIWLLTVGLGGASTSTGPVTGGQPTFTTAGERWTLDEALAGARTGEIDAISAMTPGAGTA